MLLSLQSLPNDESSRISKVWDHSAGADLLRSWFAGFLRSREIAEIDSIIQSEQGRGRNRDSSPRKEGTERPMGPLQVVCPPGFLAGAPCVRLI